MPKRTSTRRIMIVEDDPNTRALYQDAFELENFTVCTRSDADGDFLESVVEFQPDIISMDIMIGQNEDSKDGFEAIELLSSDARTQSIPVFVTSNFTVEGRINRAHSLGAIDYLVGSNYSPIEIVKRILVYLSDPDTYSPAHPSFK